MWGQALTIYSDDPAGRRWMDGERTEEEQSSQSRVKSKCCVQAGRPGLNHGLCRHHRAQVEGVEGLMSYVPQVVTSKGCMPAPRTSHEAACPSKAEPGVVGSVEAASLRTTPSLATEARPQSSRQATTAGRGRSPDRPEQREGTRTDPGHPKDGETHPRRWPGDPGLASNTGAASR